AMACWRVIEAVGSSLSVYLFASRAVRFVLITGGGTAAVSLIAKVLILPHANMYAIPMVMGISYALLCLLPDTLYLRRRLRANPSTHAIHIAS
ncbi:MAG: hypothetical protein ACREUG_17430, partial [Steroidobacteraceae bacterium]